MSILDTLNPEQEILVTDAIEGTLDPAQRVAFDRLVAQQPEIADEVARLTRTKAAVTSIADDEFETPAFAASVFDRLDAEWAPLQLRRMDPPHRHRRPPLSAGRVRSLAAAAALVLTAVLSVAFWRSNRPTPQPSPGPIATHVNPAAGEVTPPAETTDPTIELAAAAIEERTIERAHANWAHADRTEPTLAQAVALLADNRLVVRCLAPSTATALAGRDAITGGLDTSSTAWRLLGPAPTSIASRFERPAAEAVYAFDEPTGRTVEVPQPRLDGVWTARLDQDPAAIASLVHNLESLGLIVRLEAADAPVESAPSLEDSLWFDRPPSTWQPFGEVPVVVERFER